MKEMEKFFAVVGVVIVSALIIFITAVLGGTILYFMWPVAIPAVFPKVVEQGVLASRLTWWQAVAFSWVAAILFKTTINSSKKEDKAS
jgi:hypothetical protein